MYLEKEGKERGTVPTLIILMCREETQSLLYSFVLQLSIVPGREMFFSSECPSPSCCLPEILPIASLQLPVSMTPIS